MALSSVRYLLCFLGFLSLVHQRVSATTKSTEECLAVKARVESAIAQALHSAGRYDVQRGSFEFGFLGDNEVLDCEQNNCAFTNPKSPYGSAVLPLAPEESFEAKFRDPRTSPYAIESFDTGGDGQSRLWQLRFDEVVLTIGCTPPAEFTRYFAFTGYLSDLFDTTQNKWVSTFGSLQDSLGIYRDVGSHYGVENRLRTAATATDDPETSSAFNKITLVAMTASKSSLRDIKELLREALTPLGLGDVVNVIVISKPFAKTIGLEPYDSYYSLLVRTILTEGSLEDFKAYVEMEPLSSWRLTPKRPSPERLDDLFSQPSLISRRKRKKDNKPGFEARFAEGLEALIEQVEKAHRSEYVVSHAIGAGSSLGLVDVDSGLDCVERRIDFCNGDNRDAQYLSSYPLMRLDTDDKFAYVVGVNHRATGLVAYSNVAVSDVEAKLGLRSIDDEEMVGSATPWLKGTPYENMAHFYYAIRFARRCDGEAFCEEIPSDGPLGVPLDREILVNSRLYVNPKTGVGPHSSDIVMPHMMVFTPRGQHTQRDIRRRVDPEDLNTSPCMASFLSLTLCTGGISADCCNGVVSWTENRCFCDDVGKLLVETLPPSTGERGLRVLSMICGQPALDDC